MLRMLDLHTHSKIHTLSLNGCFVPCLGIMCLSIEGTKQGTLEVFRLVPSFTTLWWVSSEGWNQPRLHTQLPSHKLLPFRRNGSSNLYHMYQRVAACVKVCVEPNVDTRSKNRVGSNVTLSSDPILCTKVTLLPTLFLL